MADVFSSSKRSEIISSIRSQNTAPEKKLFEAAKLLYRRGIRYVRHYARLPGKPDLAIPKYRVAVFADGEFWHGKNYGKWEKRLPKDYWRSKVQRNRERDAKINKTLKDMGWKVIRVWSRDLLKDPDAVIRKIDALLGS